MAREPLFRASAQAIVLRPLGSEWVAYHRASGSTHFLNRTAAAILGWLTQGKLSAAEVSARLEHELGGAAVEGVQPLLQRFEELGLVRAS